MFANKTVNVINLLVYAPFMVYISLKGKRASKIMFHILLFLSVALVLYNAYSLYLEMDKKVGISDFGDAVSNSVQDITGQFMGKDNQGNDVVVDIEGNVSVLDINGEVVAMNNNQATESVKQAMQNNNATLNNTV